MSKGGGGSSTTVQKADPWAGLKPYLEQLYGSAGQWFNSSNPQYYPNQTVAGQSPVTNQALGMGYDRAMQGNPVGDAAQAQNMATTRGDYLGANPYLDQMFKTGTRGITEQFQNAIAPGIASQFSAAGRLGSGAHQGALGTAQEGLAQGLGSYAANLYGNAYEGERGRMQQATALAPSLAGMDYADIEKLMGIGQYQQQTQQDLINADIQRYNFGQQQPLEKLQALNALLQGGSAYGTKSTETPAAARNPFTGALGGAASTYGLGQAIGGMTGSTAMGAIGGIPGLAIGALLGGIFG